MKNKIIQALKDTLLLVVIAFVVTFSWQILELSIHGKIERRGLDTIIALVLGMSIYLNVKSFGVLRRVKKLIDKYE
ncbi:MULTISPECIES: hypothetical protein [Clostridia]|uniref:hypothetical protein n=1 Tax=Clostridia TaxID=186801 RepID=UPI002A8BCADF|nr:hypothetical protein [Peptostreptococcus porci]MDY5098776.1 hypothetical protein [Clostridium sp.]MDY5437441.1 hypothetical protein [Peptostreptococcus porci]